MNPMGLEAPSKICKMLFAPRRFCSPVGDFFFFAIMRPVGLEGCLQPSGPWGPSLNRTCRLKGDASPKRGQQVPFMVKKKKKKNFLQIFRDEEPVEGTSLVFFWFFIPAFFLCFYFLSYPSLIAISPFGEIAF